MIIAIDYDDTYSADPQLWDRFIEDAHARGHRVIMVTCRRDTPENREDCRIDGVRPRDRYFTGLSPKRWFMEQRGVYVSVWLDDDPNSIERGR